jgi:GWxTD domain-containing protein
LKEELVNRFRSEEWSQAMRQALAEAQSNLAKVKIDEKEIRKAVEKAEKALAQSRRQMASRISAAEDERRRHYATQRFGGHDTARGRTYVQHGPPSEIESRPGVREVWRYSDGREFEFTGQNYDLTRLRIGGADYKRVE